MSKYYDYGGEEPMSAYACADYIIRRHNEEKRRYEEKMEAKRLSNLKKVGKIDAKKVADYIIVMYERYEQKYCLNLQRLCYLVFLTNVEHYRNLQHNKIFGNVFTKGDIIKTTGGPAVLSLLKHYTQKGEVEPYNPSLDFYDIELDPLKEYTENIFRETRNLSTKNLCKNFSRIKELNPEMNNNNFTKNNVINNKTIEEIARTPELYHTLYSLYTKKPKGDKKVALNKNREGK